MSIKLKKGLLKIRKNGEMRDVGAIVAGGGGGGGGGSYDDSELRRLIAQKYTKPGTGIPESDLSQDVQNKIDTLWNDYSSANEVVG